MENPVDDLEEGRGIEPVRQDLSDQRCLLKSKDKAVVSDDAP